MSHFETVAAMISLSDSLLAAVGLLGLAPARAREALSAPETERRIPLPEASAPDDPFFLAVAEALRAAGYLDS